MRKRLSCVFRMLLLRILINILINMTVICAVKKTVITGRDSEFGWICRMAQAASI